MVDLRSDTISMPTREMLGTILEAKLGDDGRTDSRGRGEDLAVNELEDMGYFCVDSKDSKPGALVFNRAVSLKDGFKPGK